MRSGSVYDFRFRVCTKRDGLDGGGIGQTQKCKVRSVYAFGAGGIVLAFFFVNQNQFDVAAIFETLENFETSSSFLSVNENLVHEFEYKIKFKKIQSALCLKLVFMK